MNDLIKRQDATSIPVLPKEHREYQTNNLDDAYELGWYDCQKYIGQLPSAATGHWIIFPPFIEEICMCSNCKTKFKEAYQHRNICPNCGASMRGDEE